MLIRKIFLSAIFASVLFSVSASEPEWKLDWMDDFDGPELDASVWSPVRRGPSDWNNTMKDEPRLFEFRNGCIVLKGMLSDDIEADTLPYVTGGIYTLDKKAFRPGKFEIKARLHGAKGAWPAIWLKPYEHEKYRWPMGGEIDIMERLNNNHIVYQTVHSNYTVHKGNTKNPPSGSTFPINRDDWNVYGVEIHPDKIQFFINGKPTLTYPKVNDGADGQFPFYIPQFLLIDMQLGGNWVGEVDKNDLPVEMEIDWVKYYTTDAK